MDAFLASGDIRNRGVAQSIKQSLQLARSQGTPVALTRLHLMVAITKVQLFAMVNLVSVPARDTLTASILAVMTSLPLH